MGANMFRIIITAVIFLVIFLGGYILTHLGKSYSKILLSIHKLAALGVVVYLGIAIYQLRRTITFTLLQITSMVVTGVCLLVLFITGALLSLDKAMPSFIRIVHHVVPYVTLIAAAATFYLLMV
jgi:hypothetical protein